MPKQANSRARRDAVQFCTLGAPRLFEEAAVRNRAKQPVSARALNSSATIMGRSRCWRSASPYHRSSQNRPLAIARGSPIAPPILEDGLRDSVDPDLLELGHLLACITLFLHPSRLPRQIVEMSCVVPAHDEGRADRLVGHAMPLHRLKEDPVEVRAVPVHLSRQAKLRRRAVGSDAEH
jgi:hypothetical protein